MAPLFDGWRDGIPLLKATSRAIRKEHSGLNAKAGLAYVAD